MKSLSKEVLEGVNAARLRSNELQKAFCDLATNMKITPMEMAFFTHLRIKDAIMYFPDLFVATADLLGATQIQGDKNGKANTTVN